MSDGTKKDLHPVRGEFDVLARSGDRILAVECKSGRLRESQERHYFQSLTDKAQRLKRAFHEVGSEVHDITFWLVYNPHLNRPEQVRAHLDGRS